MALLTVTQVGAGTTPAFVAVAASDTVPADASSKLVLHVRNAGGSSDTVTITDPGTTPAGSAATNPSFAVPATTGEREYVLSSALQNSSGIITISHSFTTSVTCRVYRVG